MTNPRKPEQLSIPTVKIGGQECCWTHRGDKRFKGNDDPAACHYVAEKGGLLCQKHQLLSEMFNISLREGLDF